MKIRQDRGTHYVYEPFNNTMSLLTLSMGFKEPDGVKHAERCVCMRKGLCRSVQNQEVGNYSDLHSNLFCIKRKIIQPSNVKIMVIPIVKAIPVILSSFFVFVKLLYVLRAIYVPKVINVFGVHGNTLKLCCIIQICRNLIFSGPYQAKFLNETPQGDQDRRLDLFIGLISDSLRRKKVSRPTFIAPLFNATQRHSR